MQAWFSSFLEGPGSLMMGRHSRAGLEANDTAIALDAWGCARVVRLVSFLQTELFLHHQGWADCQTHKGLSEHCWTWQTGTVVSHCYTHVALKVSPYRALPELGTPWRQNPWLVHLSIPCTWLRAFPRNGWIRVQRSGTPESSGCQGLCTSWGLEIVGWDFMDVREPERWGREK